MVGSLRSVYAYEGLGGGTVACKPEGSAISLSYCGGVRPRHSDCDGLSQGQSHFEAGGGKRTKSFVGQSVSWQARDRLLGFEEGLFQSFSKRRMGVNLVANRWL